MVFTPATPVVCICVVPLAADPSSTVFLLNSTGCVSVSTLVVRTGSFFASIRVVDTEVCSLLVAAGGGDIAEAINRLPAASELITLTCPTLDKFLNHTTALPIAHLHMFHIVLSFPS
ncbi:hypothetical protein D9M68_816140 [compost metagenome]